MSSHNWHRRKTPRRRMNKQLRDYIIARDENRCVACGSTEHLQVDHIIPMFEGGSDSAENLQVLCSSCNAQKNYKQRPHPNRKPRVDKDGNLIWTTRRSPNSPTLTIQI